MPRPLVGAGVCTKPTALSRLRPDHRASDLLIWVSSPLFASPRGWIVRFSTVLLWTVMRNRAGLHAEHKLLLAAVLYRL
jgi:hypothetical protein